MSKELWVLKPDTENDDQREIHFCSNKHVESTQCWIWYLSHDFGLRGNDVMKIKYLELSEKPNLNIDIHIRI